MDAIDQAQGVQPVHGFGDKPSSDAEPDKLVPRCQQPAVGPTLASHLLDHEKIQ